ncbi:MAG: alpha-L-rhamnosidase C-terminal domain-containing protein, partial [Saprospiraceae bacterium]
WKALVDHSYAPVINDIAKFKTYIVVGAGDKLDAAKYPWNWEQPSYNDEHWPQAFKPWFSAKTRGYGSDGNWMLIPRSIPMMKEDMLRMKQIRRTLGIDQNIVKFISGHDPLVIPKNKKVTILIDQSHLTNAYPQLVVSKGKGATIKLSYAEALMNDKRQKGHRDSIEGRSVLGFDDVFLPDGGMNRMFRSLYFRTYRYAQLDIETKNEPLTIEDYYGMQTGYPFVPKASFESDQTSLKKIYDVGWRTAELCAGENYFDCPYYEQLQYTGDTRIQSLISLYVTGDDRLMRKAINDYDQSRIYEGLTQSRYPCNDMQVIPPFSLYWVSMIHDYWMHRQDDAWIKSLLNGVRDVLDWHEQRLASNGMNGYLAWWNFVDWVWDAGTPVGRDGGSSILSLQYVYTLQQAEQLFRNFGRSHEADHYAHLAREISKATLSICWDESRNELADSPTKKNFSQHANIWGILTDAIPKDKQTKVFDKILHDTSLVQATFYFKFYLFELLKKMNAGDLFIGQLKPWQDMIDYGLTTFAEKPEPVRSDCHAWSASPDYQLVSIVAGINPASPGFESVSIKPYLGMLHQVKTTMPHPQGMIQVEYKKVNGKLSADITLPGTLQGNFVWKNIIYPLHSGKNNYVIND